MFKLLKIIQKFERKEATQAEITYMLDCNSKHKVDLAVCMTMLKETDQNIEEAAFLMSLSEIERLDYQIKKKDKRLQENLQNNDMYLK